MKVQAHARLRHSLWRTLDVVVTGAILLGFLLGSVALAAPPLLSTSGERFIPAANPTMRLETTPLSGPIGATFSTKIFVDNIPSPGLGAWQTRINYDSTVVRVKSVTFGTDLFSTGNPKLLELASPNSFPSATGALVLTQATVPTVNGPTGSNLLLATVQFEAIGNGTSRVNSDRRNGRFLSAEYKQRRHHSA